MALNFKEFSKNPVSAVLFLAILGVGYLYLANEQKSAETIERLENDITEVKTEIKELRAENKRLNQAFIETLEKLKP